MIEPIKKDKTYEQEMEEYTRKNLKDLTVRVYSFLNDKWKQHLRDKLYSYGYSKVSELKKEHFMEWNYFLASIRMQAAKEAEGIMEKSIHSLRDE